MKKILLLLIFSPLIATAKEVTVLSVKNSCAPTDGHAIYFGFKDDEGKTYNISAWNFSTHIWSLSSPNHAKDEFLFDYRGVSDGTMNICSEKDKKPVCTLETGHIKLKKSVEIFKEGDVIEGEVFYQYPEKFEFHFKTIIKKNPFDICG